MEENQQDPIVQRLFFERNQDLKLRQQKWMQIDIALRTYSYLGLVISLISAGAFAFSFLNVKLTNNQLVALIVAGVGLLLSILSFMLLRIRGQLQKRIFDFEIGTTTPYYLMDETSLSAEVVMKWAEFERIARQITSKDGKPYGQKSIKIIIKDVSELGIISPNDIQYLSILLEIRNSIVHGEGLRDFYAASHSLEKLDIIIREIKNELQAPPDRNLIHNS